MSRHRFDHAAAKAYFVSLDPGQRSSQAVADKFSVSRRTVDKWRKLDGWNEAAAESDRGAAEKAVALAVRSREQRVAQDARIRDRAADLVESRLSADDVTDEFLRQVWDASDKRVRLNEGTATDHVAIAEVQAGFREALAAPPQLLAVLVKRGLAGDELVRVFRVELPGVLQERLALLDGGGAGA